MPSNLRQALTVRQIYRISTMYWDDKYGTQSVSNEVSWIINNFNGLRCSHCFCLTKVLGINAWWFIAILFSSTKYLLFSYWSYFPIKLPVRLCLACVQELVRIFKWSKVWNMIIHKLRSLPPQIDARTDALNMFDCQVVAQMRDMLNKDSQNLATNSFLLDDDLR